MLESRPDASSRFAGASANVNFCHAHIAGQVPFPLCTARLMTQSLKVQEPWLEEILAYIRPVVTDDAPSEVPAKILEPVVPAAAPSPAVPPQAPAAVDHASDVVESIDIPGPAMPAAAGFQSTQGQSDVDNHAPQPPSEPAAPPDKSRNAFQDRGDRALMSQATTAAIGSAFNGLAHILLVQNARTLEDLVREMLQPLLKTWLDDNLPELVERQVRAEIERISPGGG
jgi:uncharacterized protein